MVAVVGTVGLWAATRVYYENDFENRCDIVYWDSAVKVVVDEIGLSEESPYKGKRCGKIVFHVTEASNRGDWAYFKIPIDVPVEPQATYIVEAALKYESSNRDTRVGFGNSWWHMPGEGKAPIQGNSTYAGTASEPGKWFLLQSRDVGEPFRQFGEDLGFGRDCPGKLDALYVGTFGNKPGDKVTVWVDEARMRAVTDADRKRWDWEKHPSDYVAPPYPGVEATCPWGVCGSLEGHAGRLGVPLEIEAAVTARAWARMGFDTALRAGGMVSVPLSKEGEDYLGRFLDVHQAHGVACLPSTYLTGYYNRAVPRDECAEAIKRVVTRYRKHPALLAWWMIDEPDAILPTLKDQWIWGKEQFEALDREHPALGAFCYPEAVEMYSQYTQVALIDCYPLAGTREKPVGDAMSVANWLERAWARGAKRIWAVPQAFGETGPWRLPTPEEVRLMTYLYLARGSTGYLYYFCQPEPAWMCGYGHRGLIDLVGVPTEMGEEVERLAETVAPVCEVLLGVRWGPGGAVKVACETGPDKRPVMDAALLRGKEYDVAIVTNRDTVKAREGKLWVGAGRGTRLHDLRGLRPAKVGADGAVAVTLEPGDAAILLSADTQAYAKVRDVVLKRRSALLRRATMPMLEEARADGISTQAPEAAVDEAKRAEAAKDYGRAWMAWRKARRSAEAALDGDARRAACERPLERGTRALSRASRALEVWVLAGPCKAGGDALALMQKDAALTSHVKALTELARCQHLLRYEVMTGRFDGTAGACEDLAALAEQAETGVAGFIGKQAPANIDTERMGHLREHVAGVKP
jgi:hypothetical protein